MTHIYFVSVIKDEVVGLSEKSQHPSLLH